MTFTLAHLSDPHLGLLPKLQMRLLIGKRATGYFNWRRKRRHAHDAEVLARVTADMLAQAPDHIAVTGDLANIALPDEFPRGREWLETLGEARNVSLVPGNHDIYVRAAMVQALQHWGAQMSGDNGVTGFPYVRRRGNVALIGVSSGVPTAPFLATGRIGTQQLAALAELLRDLKAENLFRVVMVHHPPMSMAPRYKRLLDAGALMRVITEQGAELLLHGHDHRNMLNWLPGLDRAFSSEVGTGSREENAINQKPGARTPAVGVPSASASPGWSKDAAGYNLYCVGGEPGTWRCEMIVRGIDADGVVRERSRTMLWG